MFGFVPLSDIVMPVHVNQTQNVTCPIEWQSQLSKLQSSSQITTQDFNRSSRLESEKANHSSATQYADDRNVYLAEELQYGTILEQFDKCPVTICHTTLFMTREKVGAKHRRVIIDLLPKRCVRQSWH